ncbi:MAG: 30S ribosomal protein S10 [Caldiserica bacterium CG02_land_8_20_14_3_00_36_38]|jgi:small subunit ribosomal protein S10|nr:30S ribosomal protein S10 [Caldisericota bacterium]OIP13066.1 MAG: 30S ribosomal protein S10 [Caldisericum sp. CG2_30_36_11]PIP49381.1 MAG: 30S ribosomal protein S10 [Caldiserica bacterium CG23_combo_of_CG06-09_8_20_14_all_35_60]PIV54881.1 MAG: 30S ribosomal protein S10 [Caldiserica bacterium CG02_land_8_20_14_3_00_36_38]PIW10082.1 MAG: 30S ribosomal protein S10 [Caldiserica bacterium CG17_big_fil_post_rev_8_21_14_2_50_35_7]PIX29118.1 MAG: 30S ribosomal protein S10 [Caldiserica bacterium CG
MKKERLRIRLKSFDNRILDLWAAKIVEAAKLSGATVSGPIPLPTRRTIFNVLRAPNIDKDSQEAFEITVHKRLIEIVDATPEITQKLADMDIPQGVEVEIKI